MGTVFLQHCLHSHLIMLLLTSVALLGSGCLAELVLPRGHVMAGRMPYNSPFFHYNGFHNGMINHHLLRSGYHIADPRFGMFNTLPFRAGHPIAPTMGPIMGHPFHALPPQPYTSAHNMVPIAAAVHDPTFVSKNGEVEHVVKGIHAETAIKNIHGVTKREAEPMVDGVHARTALKTMPITTGMISPTMGHANVYSGYPMTYGTGIVNNMPFRTNHIAPTMAHSIAPTMTHSMLHPFHAGQPMVRTIAPSSHTGSIISHSGIHGINTGIHGTTSGLHGITTGLHGFPRMA